jgi:hypothetical protein
MLGSGADADDAVQEAWIRLNLNRRLRRRPVVATRHRCPGGPRGARTLGRAIDEWLDDRRNLRPSAQRSYRDSLELAKSRLGHLKLQDLTKSHWTSS